VLSARNGVLAREIEPQASEGRHGRKFPFDENASSHPRTRVVHRNAGVDPRFRVVDAPLDL
jgi:hypothetical protein